MNVKLASRTKRGRRERRGRDEKEEVEEEVDHWVTNLEHLEWCTFLPLMNSDPRYEYYKV